MCHSVCFRSDQGFARYWFLKNKNDCRFKRHLTAKKLNHSWIQPVLWIWKAYWRCMPITSTWGLDTSYSVYKTKVKNATFTIRNHNWSKHVSASWKHYIREIPLKCIELNHNYVKKKYALRFVNNFFSSNKKHVSSKNGSMLFAADVNNRYNAFKLKCGYSVWKLFNRTFSYTRVYILRVKLPQICMTFYLAV